MGNYGSDVCCRGLSERHDRSCPPADHRNYAWRPARPRLLAPGGPCASHPLGNGCTCHGRLCHGAARSIRHCVRGLCLHAPGDPGSNRRTLASSAVSSGLGNSDWRPIGTTCGALHFPVEASTPVNLGLLATESSRTERGSLSEGSADGTTGISYQRLPRPWPGIMCRVKASAAMTAT